MISLESYLCCSCYVIRQKFCHFFSAKHHFEIKSYFLQPFRNYWANVNLVARVFLLVIYYLACMYYFLIDELTAVANATFYACFYPLHAWATRLWSPPICKLYSFLIKSFFLRYSVPCCSYDLLFSYKRGLLSSFFVVGCTLYRCITGGLISYFVK